MLILTRRQGQQIFINNGTIQLKVLKVAGGNISLGFIAPLHTDIDHEEVYLKKREQETKALI